MDAPAQTICPCCGGEVAPIDLLMEPVTGDVYFNGKTAHLSQLQFQVLKTLIDRYPRVVAKTELFGVLYEDRDDQPSPKIIDVVVCKIRGLLDPLGLQIKTAWGIGYSVVAGSSDGEEAIRLNRSGKGERPRSALDTGDIAGVRMLKAQGYPSTDIARRLNLTFQAVAKALDQLKRQDDAERSRVSA